MHTTRIINFIQSVNGYTNLYENTYDGYFIIIEQDDLYETEIDQLDDFVLPLECPGTDDAQA